ncbi:MAG TPA: 3'-5' exonuclease [Nevskiales bacterium]|nr:3'-5' exonuclease [Nevskiales bacterium]
MSLDTTLAFDIETLPDIEGGRRLYGLEGLSDAEVAAAMQQLRLQARGSDFLPHHLQRVAAIACVLRSSEGLRVWSLGKPESDEKELITRFFEGIERYRPTLVSWNGSGFDLPVLHYRALIQGVSAPAYWDTGRHDREAKWNNYLGRYHERHTDVMDVLAAYQARAFAPLDEIAQLLGLPGKLGMDGSRVWESFLAGRIADIRNYCETDALNTYLIYLRFQHLRGLLGDQALAEEQALVRKTLKAAGQPHLQAFLDAWPTH